MKIAVNKMKPSDKVHVDSIDELLEDSDNVEDESLEDSENEEQEAEKEEQIPQEGRKQSRGKPWKSDEDLHLISKELDDVSSLVLLVESAP